ncbi:LCP family protein required for cell wall assembly [Anoxybacillus kamchatkensis]|uniref:LCP family protein n=1 Tax=Anoxybacillus ayderensis TaxID=265546 RepID=UPI0015EBA480|nr:LCP family protein [Anoxybacillus ayderensis]MBA2877234.1 LCP family protein required for cell wall assembly [Anoxybacillus ayderensis]
MRQTVKKRYKRRRKPRIFLFFISVFAFFVLFYIGYIGYQTYQAASHSYSKLKNEKEKSIFQQVAVHIPNHPISILIMGIENYSTEGERGRSDSLIVATFNPKDQSMKMLSIPRDTKTYIPELERKDKINHAYAFGGKEATIKTVEHLLNIPIDYYVTVNFEGFVNIIDKLGGVEVEVPFDFYDINSEWKKFYFKKGKMELDGEEALVYARMRKKDPRGDFGRNERQQQIVRAVIDKLSSPSIIFKIDDIMEEIGKNVETNMSISEAIAFKTKYSNFNSSKIETLKFEGEDEYIDGVYYFVPSEESLQKIQSTLQEHLDTKPPHIAKLQ